MALLRERLLTMAAAPPVKVVAGGAGMEGAEGTVVLAGRVMMPVLAEAGGLVMTAVVVMALLMVVLTMVSEVREEGDVAAAEQGAVSVTVTKIVTGADVPKSVLEKEMLEAAETEGAIEEVAAAGTMVDCVS